MKNCFLIIIFILSSGVTIAQSSFEYSYDAAGNRTQRKVITLNPTREGGNEVILDNDIEYTFSIYPNPTQGRLSIELEEDFFELEHKTVFVYDLSGNIIDQFPVNDLTIPINLSSQKAGMYIVKIRAGDYSREWKIVKI